MKVISIKDLNHGYRNLFVSELRDEVKPTECPEGFEKVLLGQRLKVPCMRSIHPHEIRDNFAKDLDLGKNPSEYGYEDHYIVIQQQKDGYILMGWL